MNTNDGDAGKLQPLPPGITAQTGAYIAFDILCLLAEARAARAI